VAVESSRERVWPSRLLGKYSETITRCLVNAAAPQEARRGDRHGVMEALKWWECGPHRLAHSTFSKQTIES